MTTEFDLPCAACGGRLHEAHVPGESLGMDAGTEVSVAECADCGGQYYPERTLDRIGTPGS